MSNRLTKDTTPRTKSGNRMTDISISDVADAISSLLLAAPHQKLHIEQIEARLSPTGRAHMREALNVLVREDSVESLDGIYYALTRESR